VTTKNSSLREGVLDLGSDTAIGEQHELLDETVGLEHLLLLNVDGIGGLGTVEMDWRQEENESTRQFQAQSDAKKERSTHSLLPATRG